MEKWEYLFGNMSYTMRGELTVDKLASIKLPKRSTLEEVVGLLGEEGWELVQADISALMYNGALILKRAWQGGKYDVQTFISKLETIHQLQQAQKGN